jgi:hypothetical protein
VKGGRESRRPALGCSAIDDHHHQIIWLTCFDLLLIRPSLFEEAFSTKICPGIVLGEAR